jgi:predicted phage terminase large subunit-like protein
MDADALSPRLNRYIPIRPTPKQTAFLLLPHKEVFYGGAAGGGKSVALLAAALLYAEVPGYSALLVRKSYMELMQPNGLIDVSKAWLGSTDATWRESDYTWRFPSGATLTFRYLQDARSELAFQGGQYQYIGIDEVTELEEESYRFLFSRLRAKAGWRLRLRMRATSNPYGPGREWVYRRFLVEGPAAGRPYVAAVFEDNPHLDLVSYEESLRELPPGRRQQLRYGDWEVQSGDGLFKREWFTGRLVELPEVPSGLAVCRSWDLAASEAAHGSDPDFTAGVLVGRDRDGQSYVIDVVRARTTPLGVQKLVRATAEKDRDLAWRHDWHRPAIRMEQEPGSAGKAMIDFYARQVLPEFDFRGVTSSGSKESRAAPVSAQAEGGHILVVRGPWNGSFFDEVCAFPHVRHDDQVDALSGAYAALAEAGIGGRARISQAIIVQSPVEPGRRARYPDPPPPPPPWEREGRDWRKPWR